VFLQLLEPVCREEPMARDEDGYHRAVVARVAPGCRYGYVLGEARTWTPDPASRAQPDGVHGPSMVVDHDFAWHDGAFTPPPPSELVLYELHVGTFTAAGTFAAVIPHLARLRGLGVTAIELMPVAQFPGARNWGYDGVLPFAAHDTYGGPDGLRALVDAAHAEGLAVHLDVVYNHVGPEGNVLPQYGPYFTDEYRTPWGDALNFAGRGSDHVRRFFVESARWWTGACHVDGLRLDAVHAIVDPTARPFVQELGDAVRRGPRRVTVVAESAANDPRLVRTADAGGLGLDGVWSDDFHHALHAVVTGERDGYYADFGDLDDLARAFTHGWVYDGRHSRFRGRRHGAPALGLPGDRFVVCAQNHDQVGNRALGDRLAASLAPDALRVVAAAVLLSPYVPLLFMGEEDGVTTPFPYFVHHSDPDLVAAVRAGRAREFPDAAASGGEPPDPQAASTFAAAVLRHDAGDDGLRLRDWYRALLAIRREAPFAALDPGAVAVDVVRESRALVVRVGRDEPGAVVVLVLGSPSAQAVALPAGPWAIRLDAGDLRFGGSVPSRLEGDGLRTAPWAAVVLHPAGP
jgi:maltooligosyltrehalose trehalohydrolase